MMTEGFKRIVINAKNGNEKDFDLLYKEKVNSIFFLCKKILGNKNDAEDAVQDIFIHVKKNIYTLKEPAAFDVWLNRVAMNICLNLKKSKAKENNILYFENNLEIPEDRSEEFLPIEYAETREKQKLVMDIIDGFPQKYKAVILLYYYEDLPYKEISKILDISIASIDHILRNARAKIKKELLKRKNYEIVGEYASLGVAVPVLTKILNSDAIEITQSRVFIKFKSNLSEELKNLPSTQNNAIKPSKNIFFKKYIFFPISIASIVLISIITLYSTLLKNTFAFPNEESDLISSHQNSQNNFGQKDVNSYHNSKISIATKIYNEEGDRNKVNPAKIEIFSSGINETNISWEIASKETGQIIQRGTGNIVGKDQLSFPLVKPITEYILTITAYDENGNSISQQETIIFIK